MYETILYPTDGSQGAEAALAHARDHAEEYGAKVHVLYVADSSFGRSGMVGEEPDGESSGMRGEDHGEEPSGVVATEADPVAVLEEEGQAVVENVAAKFGDVPVTTAVLRADPHEGILNYGEEVDADMIVMGTHGRTGLDRYLLGSVTERIVRASDIPVLTVRLDEE